MILTKEQIAYIEQERNRLNLRELEIRRIPEKERYGANTDYTRELIQIYDKHRFYNFMIELHNIAVKEPGDAPSGT